MASAKAPGVILPTVPTMPSSGAPTKAGRTTSIKGGVVKVPRVASRKGGVKLKGPKPPRVVKPKMPKDANLLHVPAHKRVKSKPFTTKLKPVI